MTTPCWPRPLRDLRIFAGCNTAELRQVASLLTGVCVPAGRVLMREGELAREAMFIGHGTARVVREGREIALLGRGDVVGEMALLEDGLRSATVTAVTSVSAYVCTPTSSPALQPSRPRPVGRSPQSPQNERAPTGAPAAFVANVGAADDDKQ
jgi:hypothetical protein